MLELSLQRERRVPYTVRRCTMSKHSVSPLRTFLLVGRRFSEGYAEVTYHSTTLRLSGAESDSNPRHALADVHRKAAG